MPDTLTIGQFSRAGGVPANTIRYYEEVGVLPPPRRSAAGYRLYGQEGVGRLRFIRRARALGLSLQRLKALSAVLDGRPRRALRPQLRALVREHLGAVRQQIAELQLLEEELQLVMHRLLTAQPSEHTEGCRCLELEDGLSPKEASSRPKARAGGRPICDGQVDEDPREGSAWRKS